MVLITTLRNVFKRSTSWTMLFGLIMRPLPRNGGGWVPAGTRLGGALVVSSLMVGDPSVRKKIVVAPDFRHSGSQAGLLPRLSIFIGSSDLRELMQKARFSAP